MNIGIAQITGTPAGESEVVDWVRASMDTLPDADMIMLPELALCGYDDPHRVRSLALEKEGPVLGALAQLAAEKKQALVFGYAERAPDGLYNALQVIDGQGRVRADYRKIHLWSGYEAALFQPGGGFACFALGGLRFGLLICYDLDFPEAVRALALKGMDCLLCISATTTGYDVVPRHVVPARAYENGCFVAFANRGDSACIGQSRIVGPDGDIVAALPGNGAAVLQGEISLAALERWRLGHAYLAERRRDLY
ncbi:nitrilase-related carbon-nitrogen hydrolase [Sodalis sp. dw_96]|uniref:nitrilase-related carbon-nitrogen hydrolase n=1 Tax=Sodalis sp. dw_96 TaxID=2719794 RepID=UPI001BD5650F|nr:nitrilase-related carbon-nitrogen hydrolase [Sodalis sp. dw_96]